MIVNSKLILFYKTHHHQKKYIGRGRKLVQLVEHVYDFFLLFLTLGTFSHIVQKRSLSVMNSLLELVYDLQSIVKKRDIDNLSQLLLSSVVRSYCKYTLCASISWVNIRDILTVCTIWSLKGKKAKSGHFRRRRRGTHFLCSWCFFFKNWQ